MSFEERIEALQVRHQSLDAEIELESRRPLPDTATVHKLKREKLRLKDEMVRLSAH